MKRPLFLTASLLIAPLWFGSCVATFSPREVARDTLSRRGEQQYAWARAHLSAPFTGYDAFDDLGVSAFDVILLSNLASGLMNVAHLTSDRDAELASLSAEVAARALSESVAPPGTREGHDLGEHNLYASHLLLVLGVEHHLLARAGLRDEAHEAIATRVARHLRRASLEHATGHAASYPGSARWPADQSVTLAALHLHDQEYGTTLAGAPIARFFDWLHLHEVDGLPWSATGGLSYARIPRGCALSFLSIYIGRFRPEEGARIYGRYREAQGIDWLGWRGFREWPRNEEGHGMDVDSGPVILGWGMAATGIGLGAARLYDDRAMAAGIERMADTVGGAVPFSGRYLFAPTLGQAMLFSGETMTPWDAPTTGLTVGETSTEWPLAPGLLFLLSSTALLTLLRRLRSL